jgi:putative transcriptional regulator
VRRHRLLDGMTQAELADRVGVTRQTILSIEKGKYTPSVALALGLAEVFGVSVETLFQLNKGENDV